MEDRNRDIYGDNYLDDYPSYWNAEKLLINRERVNWSAVIYGAGLALTVTFVCLVLGLLWAQAVQTVTLNYSFLVDLTLAGSVLFGSFKGAQRAKSMGLVHGGLIGLVYSTVGILILAFLVPINWLGALETILIAGFFGALGGVIGINYRYSVSSSLRRERMDSTSFQDLDNQENFMTRM